MPSLSSSVKSRSLPVRDSTNAGMSAMCSEAWRIQSSWRCSGSIPCSLALRVRRWIAPWSAPLPCRLTPEAGGGVGDLDVALRPFRDEVPRRALDPGVLPLVSVDLHPDAEAVPQEPRELRPVGGAGGLLPGEQRVSVERPPLAVVMGPGEVEDHAVGMKVGVVGACRPVLEEGAHDVGRNDLHAAPVLADPGVAAVGADDVRERDPDRVVVGFLDFRPEIGRGDGPQGGDRLVGVEGDVVGRAASLAAGVLGELCAGPWIETVVELVEIG